jgi:hypothetical protein
MSSLLSDRLFHIKYEARSLNKQSAKLKRNEKKNMANLRKVGIKFLFVGLI